MYEKGAGLPRRICAFDGDGFLGSREGAKSSVDFAYLAPVLNDRVTVRALCEARRVVREPDSAGGGYVVITGTCAKNGTVLCVLSAWSSVPAR